MSIFLPTSDAEKYRNQDPIAPEPTTSAFDRPSYDQQDTGPVGPQGPYGQPQGYPEPQGYQSAPKTLEEARALAAQRGPAPNPDAYTQELLNAPASHFTARVLGGFIDPLAMLAGNDQRLLDRIDPGIGPVRVGMALSPLNLSIPTQLAEQGVARVARAAIGGGVAQQVADNLLPENTNPLVRMGVDTIAAGGGAMLADRAGPIARAINAIGDAGVIRDRTGIRVGQDLQFPRRTGGMPLRGGAPFSEGELFAQQAHIDRITAEEPALTSGLAKIQDRVRIEEELRKRGGITEQEIAQGRTRQGAGAADARTWAAENRVTLSEAAKAAAEETKTGRLRKTLASGESLTDEESRAVARLLATSPALEGKSLTYRSYVAALDDFLTTGNLEPEPRKRLSDLLGISLEKPAAPARGARGERFPTGEPNQYPARVTGDQQAPVTQTFRNQPQQEIAGRARVLGGDGQMKEGVIQPSLFEPDTYMIVDPATGQPIPDFAPDGKPIPGSELRRTSQAAPTPGGPQQFPEQLWSPEAGLRAPGGREVVPTYEAVIDPATGARTQRLVSADPAGPQWRDATANPLAPDAPPATDAASLLARRRQFAESVTEPGAAQNIPSPEGPNAGNNRGRQMGMPGITRFEQQRGSVWQNVKDIISGVRTVQSAGDVSMTSRQARRTMLAYNKQWRRAVKDEINAFVKNEDAAWKVSDRVDNSPNRARYDEMGLDLPDPNNYDLSVQEEAFMHGSSAAARAVQRIPLVKRSERAAAVFMKSIRSGIGDEMIGKFSDEQWARLTPEDKQAMGKFINAVTGRGALPEVLQSHSQTLGAVFYSPRNQIANVQIPATVFFGRNSAGLGKNAIGIPRIRAEAAKALVADYAAKWAIRGLVIAAGGKIGLDIQSSDWGKIITPDGQRIDMDGGDNQMMRLIANLYAGGTTGRDSGAFTPKDRREIAWNYLRNKFAPVPGVADRLTDNIPNESPGEEAFNAGAYLWLQDVVDAVRASKEQGKPDLTAARMALTSLVGGQIGIGVDSARSPQLTAQAGRYGTLVGEDQLRAIPAQSWMALGDHPNLPEQLRPIIKGYRSENEWKSALIREYTDYYVQQGAKPGVASELARQAAARHPVSQYFSNLKNYYESQWIRENPDLADRIKAEDARNPGQYPRLSTTRTDLATIQAGQ